MYLRLEDPRMIIPWCNANKSSDDANDKQEVTKEKVRRAVRGDDATDEATRRIVLGRYEYVGARAISSQSSGG